MCRKNGREPTRPGPPALDIDNAMEHSAGDYVVIMEPAPRYDRPPAIPSLPVVPRGKLERLENQLREAIFTRSSSRCNENSVLRAAFRAVVCDAELTTVTPACLTTLLVAIIPYTNVGLVECVIDVAGP